MSVGSAECRAHAGAACVECTVDFRLYAEQHLDLFTGLDGHRGVLQEAADTPGILVARLLTLVEKGLMDADDPSMRERLVGLKLRRDELASNIAGMQRRITSGEPTITPQKIERFVSLLRDKLNHGSPELKQAYAPADHDRGGCQG